MKRIFVLVAVLAISAVIAPAAIADGPVVSITGGGTSENNGLGAGTVRTIGFTAHENPDGTFEGQVQVKNVTNTGTTLSRIHGDVVCIAPTSGAPGGEGWEIRYQVTKVKGGFLSPSEGDYLSVYVQDLAGGDLIDEIDIPGATGRDNENCGLHDDLVEWDSLIGGAIQVRD